MRDLPVDAGGEGGAVDEQLAFGPHEQVVIGLEKDRSHRLVVGDHGEDDVRLGGDLGERLAGLGPQLGSKRDRAIPVQVVERRDRLTAILEATGHVGPHATDADEADPIRHGGSPFRS
ncbi:hypothetical protein D3C86_1124140 [compost metagenome]